MQIIEFEKMFAENRHRFDMSCDSCSQSFNSLDEIRNHYASEHNNNNGYIKCCNAKLKYRCQIQQHIANHLEPHKFK